MNDQTKFSEKNAQFASSDSTKQITPSINSITNGKGELIAHGATTLNADLTITGSASPDQYVDILAGLYLVYPRAKVNGEGQLSVKLLSQNVAIYDFSLKASDGQESATWPLTVGREWEGSISYVKDPDSDTIVNKGSTLHNDLTFFGRGVANQTVELLHEGIVLQTINVGADGAWSAPVMQLATGPHVFTARKPGGEESTPWRLLINQPTPLSIQFVVGQKNFQLIGSHEPTTDRTIKLVGTATPGETGWVVNNERDLVPFTADEHGVYSAEVEYLDVDQTHILRLRSDLGRLSQPWTIRVASWLS